MNVFLRPFAFRLRNFISLTCIRTVSGAHSSLRRLAPSPTRPLPASLFPLLLLLPVSLNAQIIPFYSTDFEVEQGFVPGPLEGRDGWRGDARIEAGGISDSGDQALRIPAGDPPGRVVREFERFADSDVVYVDFFLKGAAGPVPSVSPDTATEESFLLALVEHSEDRGRFHAFDGDTWRRVPAPPMFLDEHSGMTRFVRVTVRLDYAGGVWDLYLDGDLAAVDLLMPGDGSAPAAFTRFVLRGHPERDVVVDDFYAGVGDPLDESREKPGNRTSDAGSPGEGGTVSEGGPSDRDTSRDGLSDAEALERGIDPTEPGNRFAVSLPFYENFEFRPLGNVDARGGWQVRGPGRADVEAEAAFSGDRALRFAEGRVSAAVEIEAEEPVEDVVWTDSYIRPSLHVRSVPPELGEGTAVGLYFDRYGNAAARDGATDEWVSFEVPDRDPGAWMLEPDELAIHSDSRARDDWVRVTIRQDFIRRTWSLWLNSVRVATDLGFASPVSRYNRFEMTGPRRVAHLDDVYIGREEPAGLDDDDDGLSSKFEEYLGVDAFGPDTSGDGMWDGDKYFWGFDPIEQGDFLRPFPGNSPGDRGAADRRPETPGRRPATTADLTGGDEVFIGTGSEDSAWIVGRFHGEPGAVPDPNGIEGPRTALISVNNAGYIGGYDGDSRSWRNSGYRIEEGRAADVAIYLDYETSRWMLCIDGVLHLRDLGFRDPGVRRLTRMAVGDRADSGSIDGLTVLLEEPPDLDFSGDGMTNDEKRALGLDVFEVDTNSDGIPDWWLVEHGMDPLDRSIGGTDPHGFGLTVLEEYLLGTDPHVSDTDGDGWSDFDEYLSGTDALDGERFPDSTGIPDWNFTQVGDTHELEPIAYRVDDEFRIAAAGSAAEGDSDGFAFAYREFTGNFEITAYVHRPETLEHASATQVEWPAQNGLMVRASHDASAPYSAVFSGKFGYYTRFRELAGRIASDFHHGPVEEGDARYVRLRRTGHRFRHYFSEDGEHWTLASESVVLMPETVYAGMFASSHADDFRVRARVRDIEVVQLSEEDEWYTDDPATGGAVAGGEPHNTSPFDSFAWMGEWDGTGHHDAAVLALRSPSLEELHGVGMETSVVDVGLDVEQPDEHLGSWSFEDGTAVCDARRGWIEYSITVDQPDVYLIEIEGREGNAYREGLSGFDLKLYLDDEYLGTRVLAASASDPERIYIFSPWLSEGTHRFRIFWDGASGNTRLRLDAVRFNRIEGPDTSGNGVKDWVESRLARQSATDPVWASIEPPDTFFEEPTTDNQEPSTTNQQPILTYVSPLPLEGIDRYNSLTRVERQVVVDTSAEAAGNTTRPSAPHPRGEPGIDFASNRPPLANSPVGRSVTSGDTIPRLLPTLESEWSAYLSSWNEPVTYLAERGAGYRYRADVPLAPLADNAITVSWQGGVVEERRLARWIPYNVLDGGTMTLRAGDSLLLTARTFGSESASVALTIRSESATPDSTPDPDPSYFETTPSSPLAYTFTEPGDYVVEGAYRDSDGNVSSGTLRVTVTGFGFSDRPLAQVHRPREWNAADGNDHIPAFEADPRLGMSVSDSDASGSVEFMGIDNEKQTIVARNGDDGPILDSTQVDGFRLFTSRHTYTEVVETLPDGSYLVEILLILSPVVEDVRVNVRIIVGGVLFDDGTIEKVLGPEDFDDLGRAKVRFIKPHDALTAVCHRISVYQEDFQLNLPY